LFGEDFSILPLRLQIGGLFEYGRLQRDYISYDEMGSNVKKAVIASEDQKFFDHDGFDYTAIEKAMKNNEKGKKLKEEVPFLSRLQKIFFFGRAEAGSEKDWKQCILSSSKKSGIKTLFLKDT
jgi:hypothetical protein